MTGEAKGFKVWDVQMREMPSGERGQDGTAESDQKAVTTAMVQCLQCGETWAATEGAAEKSLANVLGGIVITCPSCKQTDGVQRPAFG
ncbi:MAG TPA: hypothetical protein VIM12_14015 [Noviherbaspirillum sp.]|jgi:ribosomal protein S27E|uniref:hypothetical protein n=1 Tax=Noviherbaspirillum sp. TaxID=1926288 RepID=UPI002F94F09E